MPSPALQTWLIDSAKRLGEIESAHRAIGGIAPGRRYATTQLNFAYVTTLSAVFQAYCRTLHSGCASALARPGVTPVGDIFFRALTEGRKLDSGNPNPGNIGSDFGRFGIQFWPAMVRANPKVAL